MVMFGLVRHSFSELKDMFDSDRDAVGCLVFSFPFETEL